MGIGISSTGGGYTKKAADAKFAAKDSVTPLTTYLGTAGLNPVEIYESVVVSGAGTTSSNGTYIRTGFSGGKPVYNSGLNTLSWSIGDAQWYIFDDEFVGDVTYVSNSDTSYPWEATGWSAVNAANPAPTLTPGSLTIAVNILPTVTNYLSTNNVLLSSATVSNTLAISSVQIRTRPTANIFIGNSTTGRDAATGNHNFVFGLSAGNLLTTGSNNVFVGACVGRVNTTGSYNNFLGRDAGFNNHAGANNNFLGRNAGFNNTTGSCNNFLGYCAGISNTTGAYNNFFGLNAGQKNTTGSSNNLFGACVACNNTTGTNNNFLGFRAGLSNTTGSSNNFFGNQAGLSNTTGAYNNLLGDQAGLSNTTGANNNFIGRFAGFTNTIGSNNTIIGNVANVATNSLSGVVVLGTGARATESHQVVLSSQNVVFRSLSNTFNIGASNQPNNLTVFGNISATGIVYGLQVGPIGLSAIQQTFATITLNEASELLTVNNPVSSVIIIPADSTTNFANGSQVNISRIGVGTVVVSASPGVFLRSADNKKELRVQNSTATVIKLSANDWLLFGDIV